jgi:hypothetical protein
MKLLAFGLVIVLMASTAACASSDARFAGKTVESMAAQFTVAPPASK